MSKKEKVYISIPISGLDEAVQREKAHQVETMLTDMGYDVVNPFTLADELRAQLEREPTYDEYMEHDLLYVRFCDVIYMCRGWAESNGCRIEWQKAKKMGKEIIYEY